MCKPASRQMISASVELCETEVLFLAHPTYWHKRVTSENTQDPPDVDVDIESSRSPAKIRVLKES